MAASRSIRPKHTAVTAQLLRAGLEEAANVRNALETDLRHAVAQSDFLLHYQPILDARSGLLPVRRRYRWHHATHGWSGPDRFIPLWRKNPA